MAPYPRRVQQSESVAERWGVYVAALVILGLFAIAALATSQGGV